MDRVEVHVGVHDADLGCRGDGSWIGRGDYSGEGILLQRVGTEDPGVSVADDEAVDSTVGLQGGGAVATVESAVADTREDEVVA